MDTYKVGDTLYTFVDMVDSFHVITVTVAKVTPQSVLLEGRKTLRREKITAVSRNYARTPKEAVRLVIDKEKRRLATLNGTAKMVERLIEGYEKHLETL